MAFAGWRMFAHWAGPAGRCARVCLRGPVKGTSRNYFFSELETCDEMSLRILLLLESDAILLKQSGARKPGDAGSHET
jgi:hypothetical protein